jgi:serine/threonine-protein kinase RsbW
MDQPHRIELKVTSDTANLAPVRKRVEDFVFSEGFSRETCDAIGLVLNEAMANVIRHGYDGATDRPMIITAEADSEAVRLSIRDWAKPFEPPAVRQPAATDLKPGGLGLFCMKRLMDEVKYQHLSDGMLLTMVKRRQA